jgi:hypothetical protein
MSKDLTLYKIAKKASQGRSRKDEVKSDISHAASPFLSFD